jgi:hypothetical protein
MSIEALISPPGQEVSDAVLAHLAEKLGLRTAGGPGSGNFGHAGRPGQVGGSASAIVADLGEHDLPVFDEDDDQSPEWKVLLAHDAFLDKLEEGARGDENYERMNDALDRYVHNPERINAALRRDPELLDTYARSEEEDDEYVDANERPETPAAIAQQIEDAMADAPRIKVPVTVYRGLRGVNVDQLVVVGERGPEVTLNGFQSTSFDPRVAAAFMGEKSGGLARGENSDGLLLQIKAKYGLAFGHAHSIDGEMEMLLPHGDTYKVTGVSKVRHQGGIFPMVHLEQQ